MVGRVNLILQKISWCHRRFSTTINIKHIVTIQISQLAYLIWDFYFCCLQNKLVVDKNSRSKKLLKFCIFDFGNWLLVYLEEKRFRSKEFFTLVVLANWYQKYRCKSIVQELLTKVSNYLNLKEGIIRMTKHGYMTSKPKPTRSNETGQKNQNQRRFWSVLKFI